jgi:hypothetical protein
VHGTFLGENGGRYKEAAQGICRDYLKYLASGVVIASTVAAADRRNSSRVDGPPAPPPNLFAFLHR